MTRIGRNRKAPESWQRTRERIYERDAGVCQVCRAETAPRFYECGHVIDRHAGGTDEDDNLVCMCIVCNRLKPTHATRGAYEEWCKVPPMVRFGLRLTDDRIFIDANLPALYQWALGYFRGSE